MSITYITRSMRQVLPRVEQRDRDRRSGAYPVYSKTGDKNRTGRNKFYFDDTRSVVFDSGVQVHYPTTFKKGPQSDLTGALGSVVGNVVPSAIDQWIPHRDLSERPGSFNESYLVEQDHIDEVNSSFMTGAAYFISPLEFSGRTSDKTAIRLELPLSQVSTLHPTTSSLSYYNVSTGKFDTVALELPMTFALPSGDLTTLPDLKGAIPPILFTPYGYHFIPVPAYYSTHYGLPSSNGYRTSLDDHGNGQNPPGAVAAFYYSASSLVNTTHVANNNNLLVLSSSISQPFLLESVTVEFPIQAGQGWLNDTFSVTQYLPDPGTYYFVDCGGPTITFALLRQDKNNTLQRDLIASATIAPYSETISGQYNIFTGSTSPLGGREHITISPKGLAGTRVNANTVISGTNGTYTGSVSLNLRPSVTSHVWRMSSSGSSYLFFGGSSSPGYFSSRNSTCQYIGPISKRTNGYLQTTRNVLGKQVSIIENDKLSDSSNPITAIDSQYEGLNNLEITGGTPDTITRRKLYFDVVSNTVDSPYLLYPEDNLVFCINKHRSAGATWDENLHNRPLTLLNDHDVAIGTGQLKVTLYGSFVKENKEYHDTLNQRLETEELWQGLGEDPVLDQFDSVYSSELSGSIHDRFRLEHFIPSLKKISTVSLQWKDTLNSQLLYSHRSDVREGSVFDGIVTFNNASKPTYLKTVKISELRKSSRSNTFVEDDYTIWDCRLRSIKEVAVKEGASLIFTNFAGSRFLIVDDDNLDNWFMSYPHEPKYQSLSTRMTLTKDSYFDGTFGRFREVNYDDGTFVAFVRYGGAVNVYDDVRYHIDGSAAGGGVYKGIPYSEFVKYVYGIGDKKSLTANEHAQGREWVLDSLNNLNQWYGAGIRGWKYGMYNGFPTTPTCVFRRDRFGQPRDMLEQRIFTKLYDNRPEGTKSALPAPVQVTFHDRLGNNTDPSYTLSSNLSFEATSSYPYSDGIARNRPEFDLSTLNIVNVTI